MSIQRTCLFLALSVSALAVQAGNRSVETPVRVVTANITALTAVFTGDFTADNKPDVLVAEQGKVRVVPGNGNGTFRDSIATSIGEARPEGVADFNGDGRPDLYLVPAGGGAAVMNGNADGTFGTIRTVSGSHLPGQLAAGDFTGDGLLDLAGVNDTLNLVVIHAGDGAGNFPASTEASLPITALADVAAGDFDRDLKLDLVATGNRNATFAWNTGTSFTTTAAETDVGGFAVVAADVNGDDTMDAVAYGPALASVWLGNASRTMTAERVRIAASNESNTLQTGIAQAQLDGDGRADVIIADTIGNVTVISHDGTSLRAPHSFAAGNGGHVRIAAGDVTGEGVPDVLHVSAPTPGSTSTLDGFFSLLRGRGDRTFRTPAALNVMAAVAPFDFDFETRTAVADVTGDGRQDAVVSSPYENELAVVPGRADGAFDPVVFTNLPSASYGDAYPAGDLNGDGRTDFIRFAAYGDQPTALEIYHGQSNGTFALGPVLSIAALSPGTRVSLLRILDYTGDGHVDLLDKAGRLFPGAANGTFGAPVASGVNMSGTDVVVGNVNGDALPDLLAFGNHPAIYLNAGGGAFTSVPNPIFGGVYAVEDLNGDGRGEAISSFVQLGNGNGTFTPRNFAADLDVHVKILDVDGDGHADAVTSQGIYFGTGDGAFGHAAQTAGPLSAPIVSTADYDGNGSPDVWSGNGGFLTIVPTRTGTDGTIAPQLSVTATPDVSQWMQPVAIAAAVGTDTRIIARGAVLFRDGTAAPYAIRRVSNDGAATFGRLFPVGPANVGVAFTGDEHHAAASASTPHTTIRAETTLTVTTSSTTYSTGGTVTIKGMLKAKYGGSPAGTVTYRRGSTVLVTLPTTATQSFSSSDPAVFPVGTHTITAEYSGDGNFLASQSAPVTITVTKAAPLMYLHLPAPPITTGQHTLNVSFPSHPDVSGTVTFSCFGQSLGTATIANAHAALTATLPAGSGTCVATYGGNTQYAAAHANANATIYLGAMPTAPTVRAIYKGGGNVSLSISPISGAAVYDIYRGINGAPLTLLTSTNTFNPVVTFGAPEVTSAVYAVKARDANGTATPMGPLDLATNVTFADDPLKLTTVVRALHVVQLQTAINAVRRAAGLSQITFDAPTAGSKITAARIYAMRNALKEARGALGLATTFTDTLVTRVRLVHVQELREAVK